MSGESSGGSRSAPWHSVLRSGGAKVVLLPLTAILSILTSRLIIDNFGLEAYAQYGLLVALAGLLPFADLGMGAAVVNAVATSQSPSEDQHVKRTLTTAFRVLIFSALVLLGVNALISILDLWPTLLGRGLDPIYGPAAASIVFALISVALPFGVGSRILVGLGKNHWQVIAQSVQSPFTLLVVLAMVLFGSTVTFVLPAVAYVGFLMGAILTVGVAARHLGRPLASAFRDIPRFRSRKGARVFDVGLPMMVQMIALPIAMQSDRLVLSHLSSVTELARYNLASQLFTPVWQVVSVAGLALWPIFAKARGAGKPKSPFPMAAGFAAFGVVVCGLMAVFAPWLSSVISNGRIDLPPMLIIAFALFMTAQCAKYPLGMFMTDAKSLRFQAYCIVAGLLPTSLAISIWLAPQIGAAGPIIGSAVGVLVFQLIPNIVYIRRSLRARKVG